ncbi:23S rRNA pseudouridylate synthase B, partial [Burkholderia pseudomallei]|nr:23S rRNA pseudouridylate synthase B [Burkholderia pseudomallei]
YAGLPGYGGASRQGGRDVDGNRASYGGAGANKRGAGKGGRNPNGNRAEGGARGGPRTPQQRNRSRSR